MRAPRWLREWWALRHVPPVTNRRLWADQRAWREKRRKIAENWKRLEREIMRNEEPEDWSGAA